STYNANCERTISSNVAREAVTQLNTIEDDKLREEAVKMLPIPKAAKVVRTAKEFGGQRKLVSGDQHNLFSFAEKTRRSRGTGKSGPQQGGKWRGCRPRLLKVYCNRSLPRRNTRTIPTSPVPNSIRELGSGVVEIFVSPLEIVADPLKRPL